MITTLTTHHSPVTTHQREALFHAMLRIRRVEEAIARDYPGDRIKSPVHLSIGQESVSAAVCQALRDDDVVFGTYRGHALYLAKGGSLPAMIAELYGKATGCARGKGGSMHLVDVAAGVMGTSAIVGTTVANAAGYAYALQLRGEDRIVASFQGDGASEEGVFAETLNFAALKKLPILFVCENNRYAIHTHQRQRQATQDICGRAAAHGVPAERLDGNDVLTLHQRSLDLAAEVRRGGGPRFLEVMTYRWREHVGPGCDFALGFRGEEELEPWLRNDPIAQLAAWFGPDKVARLEAEIEAEIADAFAYAEASPWPEQAELYADVTAELSGDASKRLTS